MDMANIVEGKLDPQQTATVDQTRMDALCGNLQTSYRNWLADTHKALEKATDLNKQIYLFYERILLIDTGTMGVSISVILSSNKHLNDLGHMKAVVLIAVILGWFLLLLSILFCRLAINYSMDANRDIFHKWRNDSDIINAAMMSFDVQRMATAFKGNLVVDGKEIDAPGVLRDLGTTIKTKIAEIVAGRAAQEGTTDLSESQRHGLMAINCMQIGLILLGIAAVTVLIKL